MVTLPATNLHCLCPTAVPLPLEPALQGRVARIGCFRTCKGKKKLQQG